MFTGLVEETSPLQRLQKNAVGARLILAPPSFSGEMKEGDSLALNGCCLTLASKSRGFCFDLLQETLDRTNLGDQEEGAPINVERAMRADSRLGGHFVQGHIDTHLPVLEKTWRGGDMFLRFAVPSGSGGMFVEKGSIAINGVSLTVSTLEAESFGVWIIPHTLEKTNLGNLESGAPVNVEYDMLAKHVARLLNPAINRVQG